MFLNYRYSSPDPENIFICIKTGMFWEEIDFHQSALMSTNFVFHGVRKLLCKAHLQKKRGQYFSIDESLKTLAIIQQKFIKVLGFGQFRYVYGKKSDTSKSLVQAYHYQTIQYYHLLIKAYYKSALSPNHQKDIEILPH